ncbi:hypothetical protein GCM10023195_52160 [Actinoallomurus liliacearum]|uniref:Uncharacterized protein n=1 Tax=Actinoallomurus liliacearum TaxID=1080073 RepID=A0ABP8TQJ7_9ACTN
MTPLSEHHDRTHGDGDRAFVAQAGWQERHQTVVRPETRRRDNVVPQRGHGPSRSSRAPVSQVSRGGTLSTFTDSRRIRRIVR